MKIEKLSKGKTKTIILFILLIVLTIGVIYITNSKAKYQVTESVQIVNGKVNYSLADLNILALHVQTEENSETYDSISDVPKGNYKINKEKSYCTIPESDSHLINIPMEYKDNKVYIGITKKGTKCYVYLDKDNLLKNSILTKELSNNCPSILNGEVQITGVEDTNELLCEAIDDYGVTRYFRGVVDNNWLKFGKLNSNQGSDSNKDIWWRIIRINGNGTIRIIYAGIASLGQTPNLTGATTNIIGGYVKYNDQYKDNTYIGFKTSTVGATKYSDAHKNTNDSIIKSKLDNWWNTTNLQSLISKIDLDTGFCGDRTPYTGTTDSTKDVDGTVGYGTIKTFYGSYIRLVTNKTPTYKCENNNDLYTVSSVKNGNRSLTHPVGLITADEVVYGGGLFESNNQNYWLYTNAYYWTMSPMSYPSAYVFNVNSDGKLVNNLVTDTNGVRPVINLKADTVFKTDSNDNMGTVNNPYIVQ